MNQNKEQHIGIFDSGLGGLTVLRELKKHLPNEKFIYFGDTARVPYGNKSAETINQYVLQIVHFLKQKKVKIIIVACNTASSIISKEFRKKINIPIIDVILPSAQAACRLSNVSTVGVVGTETTISSQQYHKKINQINNKITVLGQSCSLFVPLIEEGLINHPITEQAVILYFKKDFCKKIDVLILGCTHYPMIKKIIKKHLTRNITIIDSAVETAQYTKGYLYKESLSSRPKNDLQDVYYVTDKLARFHDIASMFLNEPIVVIKQVKL